MNKLKDSELILTSSERIYHLNLKDEEVSDNIILVGAPERVNQISQKFDTIEFQIQHREFVTHTGTFNNKKITVISTGIGTDNIDIVINELDAIKNIDFRTRKISRQKIDRPPPPEPASYYYECMAHNATRERGPAGGREGEGS